MKKIISVVIMFMLFIGMVSAASIHGDYNGKPIVKIKANGQELTVQDAPAVSMDDRTMVPIYMLRQIGLGVEWDPKKYSVNVTLPYNGKAKTEPSEDFVNVAKLSKEMKPYNVEYVEYASDGNGFNQLTFYYKYDLLEKTRSNELNIDVHEMLSRSTADDVTSTRIYDYYGNTITVLTDYIRDLFANKITEAEFQSMLRLEYADGPKNTNQSIQNQTTTPPVLYSNDGKTYLGKLTSNEFDADSIYNQFGNYGSEFSSTSIWNEFGTYGSSTSIESAFNEFASSPPMVIAGNEVIGYLTINTFINGAISPYGLMEVLEELGY